MNRHYIASVKGWDGKHIFNQLKHDSITSVKITPEVPRYGRTADGYTTRNGAPTRYMVKIQCDPKWRRLRCIQFSNAGSLVLTVDGGNVYVDEYNQPELCKAVDSRA